MPDLPCQEKLVHPAADIPPLLEGLVGDLAAFVPFPVQVDILIRGIRAILCPSGLYIVFPELPHSRLVISPDRGIAVADAFHSSSICAISWLIVTVFCSIAKMPPLIIVRHCFVCPIYYHGGIVFTREVLYRILLPVKRTNEKNIEV